MGFLSYLFGIGKRGENDEQQVYRSMQPEERRLYDFLKKIEPEIRAIPNLVDSHDMAVWAIVHENTRMLDDQASEPLYTQNIARLLALGLWEFSGNSSRSISSEEVIIKGDRVIGLNKSHYAGRHNFFVDELKRERTYREFAEKLKAEGTLDLMESVHYVYGLPEPGILDIKRLMEHCDGEENTGIIVPENRIIVPNNEAGPGASNPQEEQK